MHERSGTCSYPVGADFSFIHSLSMIRTIKLTEEKSFFLSRYYTGTDIGFYCDVSISRLADLAFRKRLKINNITVNEYGIVLTLLRIRIQ